MTSTRDLKDPIKVLSVEARSIQSRANECSPNDWRGGVLTDRNIGLIWCENHTNRREWFAKLYGQMCKLTTEKQA